jgi:hypothetical protein
MICQVAARFISAAAWRSIRSVVFQPTHSSVTDTP